MFVHVSGPIVPSAGPFSAAARRIATWLLLACVCALAGACAPAAPESTPSGTAEENAPARRVVSLAPSFTETLIALGAGDLLVGIGRYDPEVPGRASLPRLGDASSVSLESLLALDPDLVLVNSTVLGDALRPASARVRVVVNPADRLEDSIGMIGEIGRLVGRERAAEELVAGIRRALVDAAARAARRRADGVAAPKVLVVVQRRPLYAAGRTSFVAELLRAVGAENALDDVEHPWPPLSEEAAVARAPDVILDASEGDNATEAGRAALLAAWQRFPSVPAVRDGRVLVIREDAIFRAGPRIPEALTKLEALLFPPGEGGR